MRRRSVLFLLAAFAGPVQASNLETLWLSLPDDDFTYGQGIPGDMSDDGKLIAIAMPEGQIALRDANLITRRILRVHRNAVKAVAVSPAGTLVATSDELGEVAVTDTASGNHWIVRPAISNLFWNPGGPWAVVLRFSEKGDLLAGVFRKWGSLGCKPTHGPDRP